MSDRALSIRARSAASRNLHAAVVAVFAFLAGCIPIPFPGGATGEIPTATIANIERGDVTRADVLLTLADPEQRLMHDECFVYRWEERKGGVLFFFGAPMAVPVAGATGEACHKLVIRFAPDGRVAKVKVFQSKTAVSGMIMGETVSPANSCSDAELERLILEWLDVPASSGM